MKNLNKRIAVVGATGAVGRVFLELLEENFSGKKDLHLLASKKSEGKLISCGDQQFQVKDLSTFDFSSVDIAFFSAGADISGEFAPKALSQGCTVIDNSSKFRREENIPLIIPEVNGDILEKINDPIIISNPNCSTAQLLVALKPIHDLFEITRVDVVTFQAVSGSGQNAIDELINQTERSLNNESTTKEVYGAQIAFNVIPAGNLEENDYTDEEMKISYETKKILDEKINISATSVRVPVIYGHSIAAHIKTNKKIDLPNLHSAFEAQTGLDKYSEKDFLSPNPLEHAEGRDPVSVGRIRADLWEDDRVNIWIVADNLRKGAALNSLQIMERIMDK